MPRTGSGPRWPGARPVEVQRRRIWRKFHLKPHRADLFKRYTEPLFIEKGVDVVGLYHHPPEQAAVLCVDGKF